MSDLGRRIANLSPEQRALLEKRLLERAAASAGSQSIPRRDCPGPWPLSFTQQRLWFIDQLQPGITAYNEASGYRIGGRLDAGALERAIGELLRRHESLRTGFAMRDGAPVQTVSPPQAFSLPVTDLRGIGAAEREEAARRAAAAEAAVPFDLSAGQLFRARLIILGDDDHVLVSVTHHIASDGWSSAVGNRDLSALYNAFAAGQPSPLPDLPIQYADFAVWQRGRMTDETLKDLLSYWQERLAGAPVLELPTDMPRPSSQSFAGARYGFDLPDEPLAALDEIARGEGATRFMALLAIFRLLMGRYAGQDDFVIGTPIANRNRVELEDLVGFFANTLAMRTSLAGAPTFRELLRRERDTALGAFARQDMPFDRLVESLHPDRNQAYTPIYQIMFAFQNAPSSPLTLEGVETSRFEFEKGTSKFDLILFISKTRKTMQASLEYNTDLFAPETAARVAGHFVRLLEAAAGAPDAPIETLEMLTAEERRTLLVDWNATSRPFPRDKCVNEVFAETAARFAEAPAVEAAGATLTYRELDERSSRIANRLRRLGVGHGSFVGLALERSADMVAAMLAVLKAGGAYVPLDPSYPRERIEFMVRDASLAVILTQTSVQVALPHTDARIVKLDSDWASISEESASAPANVAGAQSPAYVIFTSGSTGTPKGTVVPHRAINRLVINTDYVQVRPADVIGQVSNASFDAATFEIWGALLNGARLVVISKDVVLSPREFLEELRTKRVGIIFLTAALFHYFAREVPGAFSTLDTLMFGGEACDSDCVRKVLADHPPRRLMNCYGPTETTTFAVTYEATSVPAGARSVPIGRPIANTTLYVLDACMRAVPVGVHGELFIGGDGVALGYLNRPALTAERFVPNPFGPGLLYRTGDIVRYLPDGNVDFLGRADNQVKIRGFRVELGEIEAAILGHDSVKDACVVCRADASGDKRLAAYFVPRPGRRVSSHDLRDFLRRTLPDYMVPSAFVALEALPLTPNGKIDRRALPAPGEHADAARLHLAARTPVEDALARIWAEALGVASVGVRDDFFELGGHSLLAVKVFTEIEQVFGLKLPLATLFEAPTVEKLAAAISRAGCCDLLPPLVKITSGTATPPLFCIATADAFIYAELARAIGSGRAVYGLSPQGIVPVDRPDIDIPELAARYIALMRGVQPAGPYYLAGMCAGGVVAYEIARQLALAGQSTALLALVDTPGHFSLQAKANVHWQRLVRVSRHAVDHFMGVFRAPWGGKLSYVSSRTRRLARRAAGLRVEPLNAPKDRPVDQGYWMAYNAAYLRSMAAYRPKPFDGRIVFFMAADEYAWGWSDTRLKWRRFARRGVDAHTFPGNHMNLLREPQVSALAAKLREYLPTAQP
jgi:amino acid adenylation domain-containing protein